MQRCLSPASLRLRSLSTLSSLRGCTIGLAGVKHHLALKANHLREGVGKPGLWCSPHPCPH